MMPGVLVRGLVFILILGGGLARADEGMWQNLQDNLEVDARVMAFATKRDPADSALNPGNQFIRFEDYSAELELRPDFFLARESLFLSFKPRLNLSSGWWNADPDDSGQKSEARLFVNEWQARFQASESLFVSYGRENLQWGPSYLYSPSNPFFRDNGRKNPKREMGGMEFGRLIWLAGQSLTLSFIANTGRGRQNFGSLGFDKAAALKLDYQGLEDYAGLILSYKEEQGMRLGWFAGGPASDALLLYAEGAFTQGVHAFYPPGQNSSWHQGMELLKKHDSNWVPQVLGGLAYTFESGPTLTLEYTYYGPGYDDDEAKEYYSLGQKAGCLLVTPGPWQGAAARNLGQALDPGLVFLRRNYLMLQAWQGEIQDCLDLTFRYTANLDDGSGRFFFLADWYVGDHTQLFFSLTMNQGKKDSEFGLLLDSMVFCGVQYTF
jgi:hypothetical protein